MAFNVLWFVLNHIRACDKHTSKQASMKTDFIVDLTWWGLLRLAPITVTVVNGFCRECLKFEINLKKYFFYIHVTIAIAILLRLFFTGYFAL